MNTWRLDFWRGPAFTQTLIGHTKAVDATYTGENGVTYAAGPRVADVEAVTHKPVYTYQVKNVVSPVADNVDLRVLSMYRPQQVAAVGQGGVRPAPAHVVAAPQPVSAPQAIRTNWDHPHEFSASNPRTVQPAGNVNNGGGPRQQTIIRKSPPYDPPAMHHSAAPAAPRSNGGGKPAQAPASAPAKHR